MRLLVCFAVAIFLLLIANPGVTPPTNSCSINDTDGDGFPNDIDEQPHKFDVYVEVDYMGNISSVRSELHQIEQSFKAAPIVDSNGTSGITLHIAVSNQVPQEYFMDMGTLSQYKETYFDHPNQGYHYALIVTQAHRGGSPVAGVAKKGEFMVTHYDQSNWTGNVFMHELGHSLGLTGEVFEGIDSRRYSYDDYPSVLNYNSPNDSFGFASKKRSDTAFDDWKFIVENSYNPISSGSSSCPM